MRHRKAGLHLSRTSAHRQALFSNLVAALLTHERIRTTEAKAKETRRLAERTITFARRVGDILGKAPERRTADESARVVHAVRMARRIVRDRGAVTRLFDDIAPRFFDRRGGYTRIVKIGQRPGDAAPMSLLELIPDEAPKAPAAKSDKSAGKGAAPPAKGGEKAAKGGAKADKPAKKAPSAKAEKADKPAASKKKTKSEE